MMKKILFTAGTLAVIALASCSNDETVDSNVVNPNEIRYNVITNNVSRVADEYSSSNSKYPDSFRVFATTTGTITHYFDIEKATLVTSSTGTREYTTDGGVHYWPDASTGLDFFAFANAYNGATEITALSHEEGDNMQIGNVSLQADASTQHDMLYAFSENLNKTSSSGKVNLNFRHAFAQMAFKVKNESRGIDVKVQKIEIYNPRLNGTFSFGAVPTYGYTSTTAQTTGYYNGGTYDGYDACSWTLGNAGATDFEFVDLSAETTPYIAPYPAANADGTANVGSDSAIKDFGQTMYIIPQAANAWDPSTYNASATDKSIAAQANGKMYFLLYVKIQNVASPNGLTGASSSDTYLYGDASTFKSVAIPVAVPAANNGKWMAGMKYTYTFIFGRNGGNGGYNPENPDPENPILVPITYDLSVVTVDDYANVENKDINMSTK
jgi:hypothetical protein